MKGAGPLMDAKLDSKTYLSNMFFDILSDFCCVWIKSFQKVQIWQQQKFYNQNGCKKMQNLTQIPNLLKNFSQKLTNKKVLCKSFFKIIRKSWKSSYFHHIFVKGTVSRKLHYINRKLSLLALDGTQNILKLLNRYLINYAQSLQRFTGYFTFKVPASAQVLASACKPLWKFHICQGCVIYKGFICYI